MTFQIYTISVFVLLYFLYRFFPISPSSTHVLVEPPYKIRDVHLRTNEILQPEVDKLIFMVIDALRLDFITKENMPFLVNAADENGCVFKVKVQSPTVTLPRIKSLTMGNVPQFADVILNLASTEVASDSLLHRADAKGKKMVFYGDDTWLKLYPDVFSRSEGTSSFYVNDFTEVDYNVTRHLDVELSKTDWDVMFLHYLGLDHIGHVYGPFSPLIKPKLQEMDGIIEKLYNGTRNFKEKTLIVVTGDHGMKDTGGHGGSTFAEVVVPLAFVGFPCEEEEIEQVDVPITLSYLMNLEFPSMSVGKVITSFKIGGIDKLLYGLRYNLLLLKAKVEMCGENFLKATDVHYQYLKTRNASYASKTKELYEGCLKDISHFLITKSAAQDATVLYISCALLVFLLFTTVSMFFNMISIYKLNLFIALLFSIFIMVQTVKNFDYSYNLLLFLAVLLYVHKMYRQLLSKSDSMFTFNCFLIKYQGVDVFLVATTILTLSQPLTYLSSSFIEEEHQVWYFFGGTLILITLHYLYKTKQYYEFFTLVIISMAFRFLKKFNQTGDKWASAPDISDWLHTPENKVFLEIFTFISIFILWCVCCCYYLNTKFNISLVLFVLAFNFIYRLNHSNALAKCIWIFILIYFIFNIFNKAISTSKNLIMCWLLIISLLLRPHNIVLVPFCILSSSFISDVVFSLKNVNASAYLAVTHFWLSNVLYFCQGHSNSLSSVDVAVGYVGLNSYEPAVVFILVLCHTYAFPVLIHLLLIDRLCSKTKAKTNIEIMWNCFADFQLFSCVVVVFTCLLHMNHLFVWSVFAPKLLIETSHCLVLFIEYSIYSVIYKIVNVKFNRIC